VGGLGEEPAETEAAGNRCNVSTTAAADSQPHPDKTSPGRNVKAPTIVKPISCKGRVTGCEGGGGHLGRRQRAGGDAVCSPCRR